MTSFQDDFQKFFADRSRDAEAARSMDKMTEAEARERAAEFERSTDRDRRNWSPMARQRNRMCAEFFRRSR
jgi:hypothetical protein